MNINLRISALPIRAWASVALALACVNPALVSASDAPKRELAASSPSARAPVAAQLPAASMQQEQLQRLALEAALVDSSAFGQLRMLRDVEAKAVEATHGSGASEHCR